MEHIGGAVGNDVGLERVISSDPNFQRVIAVAFLPRLLAVARSDISQYRRWQRVRIDLNQAPINSSWVPRPAPATDLRVAWRLEHHRYATTSARWTHEARL